MAVVEHQTDDAGRAEPLQPSARSRAGGSLLRRVGVSAIAIGAVAVLLLAAGFCWFLWRLPADEVVLDRGADGIVVLTGGASRILDAMELLAAGRGKRLLISGAASPATTSGEISRLNPEYGRIVNCCVDFDRSLNTLGNAIETKRWVESRGFRSLIVVTSNYHMPRTMAELGRRLPDVSLVPYPVVTDKMRTEAWWSSPPTAKLLFSEYLKYIVAQVRFRLGIVPAETGVGRSRAA